MNKVWNAVALLVLSALQGCQKSEPKLSVPGFAVEAIGKQRQPVMGIDVSHHQNAINWMEVINTGVSFVYLKATDGITYQDPRFKRYAAQLNTTELLHGAYHYFQADDDPIQQADNFLNTIADSNGRLVPVLDVETSEQQSPLSVRSGVKKWLEYVEQKLGCQPMLYASANYWRKYLGAEFNQYRFWLADYNPQPQPPETLQNWVMWQYSQTGSVRGVNGDVDLNVIVEPTVSLKSLACY